MAAGTSTRTRAARHRRKVTSYLPRGDTGTGSTTPARRTWCSFGDGAARDRWKPRVTKFRRKAIERGTDLLNAGGLGRPAHRKRNAATASPATRVGGRGQKAAWLEAGLRRLHGSRAIAYQRSACRISDG